VNDTLNEFLKEMGWREHFDQQIEEEDRSLIPARVSRQDLNRYHLLSENGRLYGILPGRTRIEATSKADLPAVGDWVLCSPADAADPTQVVIERVLTRFSKFSRKEAGEKFDEQVVAANVDTVFIVTGLDDNFNPNRIERYLVLAWNSGSSPVVVLSKLDLVDNVEEAIEMVTPITMGAPVHAVSALNDEGLDELAAYTGPGMSVALLGSSGVGKSTLINAFLGYEHFQTGEVREGDSKGRHTTTHRELCKIESGGMLIDTPGMREIQFWTDDASAAGFDDVEELALQCRFTDCSHDSEPGCAIRSAIEAEQLDAARLESYRKFQRELEHFAAKQHAGLQAQKREERRKFSKSIRNRPTKRD
jgi:ribosome biogenesis GTPase